MQYVQYFAVLGYHKTEAWSLALEGSGQRNKMAAGVPRGQPWCLLFVLIRQGLRGGSGSQRLTRALGIETGNPIMTFEQRSSFFPATRAQVTFF